MNSKAIFVFIAILATFINCQDDDIDELEKLIIALNNTDDSNSRIGTLSMSNYLSVKSKLPSKTIPILVDHEEDLTQMVLNGTVIAALVTGLPDHKYHRLLNVFSSQVVTLHSIFMAPDKSLELPHGVELNFSTKHLALAINTAIMKIQMGNLDKQIAEKNSPKELVYANTCKGDKLSQFNLPNKKDAKGLFKEILETKKIKILSMGPYNWGDNDGNYMVT